MKFIINKQKTKNRTTHQYFSCVTIILIGMPLSCNFYFILLHGFNTFFSLRNRHRPIPPSKKVFLLQFYRLLIDLLYIGKQVGLRIRIKVTKRVVDLVRIRLGLERVHPGIRLYSDLVHLGRGPQVVQFELGQVTGRVKGQIVAGQLLSLIHI